MVLVHGLGKRDKKLSWWCPQVRRQTVLAEHSSIVSISMELSKFLQIKLYIGTDTVLHFLPFNYTVLQHINVESTVTAVALGGLLNCQSSASLSLSLSHTDMQRHMKCRDSYFTVLWITIDLNVCCL